jgi:hypothetical protein
MEDLQQTIKVPGTLSQVNDDCDCISEDVAHHLYLVLPLVQAVSLTRLIDAESADPETAAERINP